MTRYFAFTIVALLAMAIGVRAQESASSGIAGQVLDTSKAGVPGATITVTNLATNAQRVTQSDPEGRFSVPIFHRRRMRSKSSCQGSRPRNSRI